MAPGTAAVGTVLVDTADIGPAVTGTAAVVVDTAPVAEDIAAVADTALVPVADTALVLTGKGIVLGVDIAEGVPAALAEEPDLDPERIPVRFRQPPESLLQSTTRSIFVNASLSPFLQCSLAQLLIF